MSLFGIQKLWVADPVYEEIDGFILLLGRDLPGSHEWAEY